MGYDAVVVVEGLFYCEMDGEVGGYEEGLRLGVEGFGAVCACEEKLER